jgi:hypothetical protein
VSSHNHQADFNLPGTCYRPFRLVSAHNLR